MNRRRRIRRRPSAQRGKKIQVNFLPIIVIILLSICAGYFTAKYVIYPLLGYEPTGLSILKNQTATTQPKETTVNEPTTTQQATTAAPTTDVVEDKPNVKKSSGYALQFGSYSTKAAAEQGIKDLKASGIKAEIVKKDGAYKVVGQLFDTKEEAKKSLDKMDKSVGAFITTIEK